MYYMKEVFNGCCVCSDEKGWDENPLVYCDGAGCNIAVHQACYGIVSVPTGNWYCRKCESQDRPGRIRCELCPFRDGALKRTDNGGWAHVVCALYIPEVRFASVTTMEPVVITQMPPERFNKVCYICQQSDKPCRATFGACMQCNKPGCKLFFHVTCAQTLGLLCEEEGTQYDNVNYCGYCQEHYSKVKKGNGRRLASSLKSISCDSFERDQSSQNHDGSNDCKENQHITGETDMVQKQSDVQMTDLIQPNSSCEVELVDTAEINISASLEAANSPSFNADMFADDCNIKNQVDYLDERICTDEKYVSEKDIKTNLMEDEMAFESDDNDIPLQFIEEPNLSSVPKSSSNSMVNNLFSCIPNAPASTSVIQSSAPIQNGKTVITSCSSSVSAWLKENERHKDNFFNFQDDQVKSQVKIEVTEENERCNVPFQNGLHAPHMLGNQLNPASSMAQKMSDTLYAEIEDNNIYTIAESGDIIGNNLIGPQLYGKIISSVSSKPSNLLSTRSISDAGASNEHNYPQSLEQLLERQWEQGSPFLMEQTVHFDLASLLAGLHQISVENTRLEEYIRNMEMRVHYLAEENKKLEDIIESQTTK